jgi:hypothetical protein
MSKKTDWFPLSRDEQLSMGRTGLPFFLPVDLCGISPDKDVQELTAVGVACFCAHSVRAETCINSIKRNKNLKFPKKRCHPGGANTGIL